MGIIKKDDRNNYFYGDVVAIDCDSNFIRTDEKLTVTLGVKDLIVINTKDALLVAERSCAQKVKDVVAKLNVDNRNEISHYSNEFRSWGEIEKVDSDNKYIVNRIIIKLVQKFQSKFIIIEVSIGLWYQVLLL